MDTNRYNYDAIRKLCKQHLQEIKERKPLSHILHDRKVRYVNKAPHVVRVCTKAWKNSA